MSRHTKKVRTAVKVQLKIKLLNTYFPNTFPRCYWCNRELLEEEITLDHVRELANLGDRYELSNLVISCEECNNYRSNNKGKFRKKLKKIYGKNWLSVYSKKIGRFYLT